MKKSACGVVGFWIALPGFGLACGTDAGTTAAPQVGSSDPVSLPAVQGDAVPPSPSEPTAARPVQTPDSEGRLPVSGIGQSDLPASAGEGDVPVLGIPSSDAGTPGSGGAVSASGGALIINDRFWKDTSGTPIYSQGGGVLKVDDTYYWYGVKYRGAVTYAANPIAKIDDTGFVSVTAYSSKDLANWTFENDVLTGEGGWFGRLGVVYHAGTQKYVLVAQGRGGLYFATSDTPTGKFTLDNVQTALPDIVNGATGDQTTFQDDDGKAYLICSSINGRANLYVAPLRDSDYLGISSATRIYRGTGREGNALFKHEGTYYFCSSDLHGWNASHTYCMSASNITGPYGPEFVMDNTEADFSHVTQTGFFVSVQGTLANTVIFAGDRWSDFAGNGLGYNQWMPISFDGTTPRLQSLSEWSIDAVTGTWSVGKGNNYARNPTFEADRVAMAQPAGWRATSNLGGATPHRNASPGHTGRWFWQLEHTASYQADLSQTLTDLPNGSYRLSAWVKSSGGQPVAQLVARNFGGADKTAAINGAQDDWTEVSISGIEVSNGQAEVGVTTTANANQWLDLDDFALVRE